MNLTCVAVIYGWRKDGRPEWSHIYNLLDCQMYPCLYNTHSLTQTSLYQHGLCCRYLWLEKDGRPDWSRLEDGSDSDERHIFHKALYDATNQAIIQVYEEANRKQVCI